MRHFVKLHADDGRDVAFAVDLIERVYELDADAAAKKAKTGCVAILTAQANDFGERRGERVYIIGTVDSVLAAIRDAQEGRPT